MAWSPVRRVNAGILRVKHPGDYATRNSNNPRDGTSKRGCKLKQLRPLIRRGTSTRVNSDASVSTEVTRITRHPLDCFPRGERPA